MLLIVALAASGVQAASPDNREALLKEQIGALETVVAAAKDKDEQARLQVKLDRLRQELRIVAERRELDVREQALQADRPVTLLDQLREKLRAVNETAPDVQVRINDIDTRRLQAVTERDGLAAQASALRNQPGTDEDRQAGLEERLVTANEELRALALEREALESELALVQDAEAERNRLKADDELAGRPSLKALFDGYTRLRAERKSDRKLGLLSSDLDQSYQISQASLEISRQKLAKFDEELALLQKQTGFFHRDPQVDRLLAQQRTQKNELLAVLPFMSRQVDAIKRSQQALHQRQELASLENAFQEEQFSQLKTAYLQRVRWPALVILGLILFHLLLSYLVFPRFSKGEGLFMSRRLLRYALVFVGVCVVATSLFDDLSMVAATLGIVSAALVIALQDVCTSVAGWAVIMLGGKLGIGDRIEVDGTRGDVLDIQLLRTTMLEINGWLGLDQPTGRVIVIPNNFIFKNKVFNFSHGHPYIWGKVDLTVTFATPVASAMLLFQRVLEEETKEQFADARRAAAKMQRRYGVADADYVPIIYTQIADSGVTLSLFFVSHYRDFPATRNRLNRRLVAELERHHHIQLAYTTLSVLASSPGAVGPSAVLGADYTTPPFPPPKQG